MAEESRGRGWYGDSQGHAKAGSQSSGNPYAARNLTLADRKKGGKMSGGNFKNDPKRAREAGRKGGENSHRGKKLAN